jgi:hypothetical protein
MSTGEATGAGAPSEEELRAAYEAELKKLRVEHLLIETVVGMVNVGMRRTGLGPGTEDERDPGQVRLAIESIRALMPLVEQVAPQQVGQIRAALSQLQLAFVRIGGGGGAGGPGEPGRPGGESGGPGEGGAGGGGAGGAGSGGPGGPERPDQPPPERTQPGQPGPAQRSGRLWVPGQ